MPRARKLAPLICLALGLPFAGCVSTAVAPRDVRPGPGVLDARFPGTWKSARLSQLGPAAMRFTFGCDCTYESRARVLLMSVREKGRYSTRSGEGGAGRFSFSRGSGEVTTWRFRFEGDRLILEEAEGESHSYRRTERRSCPGAGESS